MSNSSSAGARRREIESAGAPGPLGRAWSAVLGRMLRLSPEETRVTRRGFVVMDPEVVERLETIGARFVCGYNSAVSCNNLVTLIDSLEQLPSADLGFAYEGAAMGLAVSDWMTPNRRLFDRYVQGPAHRHEYMAWVGLGWSFARLPVSPLRVLDRYRTLNKWLALDGYGFHEGYFGWCRTARIHDRPRSLTGDMARVFDQGLGRSLWFICGASPAYVAETIDTFDRTRRPDLWAGIGLAAAYAGGVTGNGLLELKALAGTNFSAMAQGAVFAAQARRRAGNADSHSELACASLLGQSLNAAADIALDCLPSVGCEIAIYQRWRDAVQAHF